MSCPAAWTSCRDAGFGEAMLSSRIPRAPAPVSIRSSASVRPASCCCAASERARGAQKLTSRGRRTIADQACGDTPNPVTSTDKCHASVCRLRPVRTQRCRRVNRGTHSTPHLANKGEHSAAIWAEASRNAVQQVIRKSVPAWSSLTSGRAGITPLALAPAAGQGNKLRDHVLGAPGSQQCWDTRVGHVAVQPWQTDCRTRLGVSAAMGEGANMRTSARVPLQAYSHARESRSCFKR